MTDLTKLAQLAEQHSSSYASPHHFVLSVAGLRSIIAALAAQPGAVPADCDVRKILLKVVPGWDGEGVEVYAKSVAEVEAKLGEIWAELEEWQMGIRKLAAAPTEAKPAQTASKPVTVASLMHTRSYHALIQVIHELQQDGQYSDDEGEETNALIDLVAAIEAAAGVAQPAAKPAQAAVLTPAQRRELIDRAGDITDGLNQDDFADEIINQVIAAIKTGASNG